MKSLALSVFSVFVFILWGWHTAAQEPVESVFINTPPEYPPLNTDEDPDYPVLFYSTDVPSQGEIYRSNIPHQQRTGAFQKINFNVLWVPKGKTNSLGLTELDLGATFALPMPKPESPLIITPKFKSSFFEQRRNSQTFYTTGVDLHWLYPLFPGKLTTDIGTGISYSGDFHASGRGAIRIPAHLAGIWNYNPRVKMIFGVLYLDRNDSYNVLPMGGLVWTPNDELNVELLFPRARIAKRINWFTTEERASDWFYTAFEFGGGTWGYKIEQGRETSINYRDMRLLIGLERTTSSGFMLGLETGYMCEREVQWNNSPSHHFDDSVFIRLRTAY